MERRSKEAQPLPRDDTALLCNSCLELKTNVFNTSHVIFNSEANEKIFNKIERKYSGSILEDLRKLIFHKVSKKID
tara:strand:- start:24093 stop:24320 length:228 start_codon:yes stop_codon:yes gene_type:complete